jgi:hypothetical protein
MSSCGTPRPAVRSDPRLRSAHPLRIVLAPRVPSGRASVGHVTISEDFGIPPGILAQAEATFRDIRPFLASIGPVVGIVERQRAAMEQMRASFEQALSMGPPPASRRALADLVHQLREESLQAAALTEQAQDAQQTVVALVGPELDPEQLDEVRQGVAELEASPELREKLRRVVSRIDWSGIRELTPWAALTWATAVLTHVANLPISEHLSADQVAPLQNRLQVLAIVVALASIIIMMRPRS